MATKQELDAADAKAKADQDAADEAARVAAEQDAANAADGQPEDDGKPHGVQKFRVLTSAAVLRASGRHQGQRYVHKQLVDLNADDEDVQRLVALGGLELASEPYKGRITAGHVVIKAQTLAQENLADEMPDGIGFPFSGDAASLGDDESDEK